jgi:hypothetical protein
VVLKRTEDGNSGQEKNNYRELAFLSVSETVINCVLLSCYCSKHGQMHQSHYLQVSNLPHASPF